jgi:phosphoribosyl 1,2-cyclic phosphodiesterase
MPMFICPLFSGSKGNSTFIATEDTAILVDAGMSARAIGFALENVSASYEHIKAVVITHEHIDHIRAISVISRRYDIPIYANEDTWNTILNMKSFNDIPLKNRVLFDGDFYVGSLAISPFKISHDAADPVGFSVFSDNRKAVVATDTGYFTKDALSAAMGADACVIESNHDVHMLENGPYPVRLKNRILSRKGHLSNHDSAQVMEQIIQSGCRHFSLAHLSQDNNTPEAAFDSASAAVSRLGAKVGKDVHIHVAPQFGPGDAIII